MGRPCKPVLRVDKKTGEVLERFPSLYAARDSERRMNQLDVWGQCQRATLGRGRYIYRYEDGFDSSEDWEGLRNRPVWIVDGETGRIGWAVNVPEAAKALRVSEQSVYNAVYEGYVIGERYKLRLQRRLDEWSLLKKMLERKKNEASQG